MCKSEMRSTLTEAEAKRLMTRATKGNASPAICEFCGELIQIGDTFIRKRRSGKLRMHSNLKSAVVRYYHEKCWLELLH